MYIHSVSFTYIWGQYFVSLAV